MTRPMRPVPRTVMRVAVMLILRRGREVCPGAIVAPGIGSAGGGQQDDEGFVVAVQARSADDDRLTHLHGKRRPQE